MKTTRLSVVALLAVGAISLAPLSAHAQTTLNSTIKLSFWGVNVGKMNSSGKIGPNDYALKGGIKTSGLGKVIGKATAFVSSYGSIQGDRIVPAAHALTYNTRKKKGSLKMNFASGNLSSSVSTPKIKYKEGAIPVKKSHFNAVLDPLSSIIFPVAAADVGNGRKVCNRTVPVFDGKARYNLVSRYKSTQKAKVSGFKGNVFTCALRYQPISGIRPFKQNVKFMKANRNLEITVARVGKTNVYTLFGFKVKTQKGTAKGTATKFKTQ